MEIETLAEIEIEEIDKIGPKGLSAYEVYVKNGGTLSETEWLKSLRGEQGLQGKPGAVKMQVVDTLPDVGETDTIYLLKKDTPGEQNLYDEYVYTETTGWEHIGDTSVDLTDYYTKEETDEKLNNIVYSLDLPNSGGFLELNSLDYQKINDYVNYCKDINRWVPIQLSTRDYKNGVLPIFNIYSSTNFANISFSFITIRAGSNYETLFTFDFYGSWGEDGYHVSGGRSKRQDNITPLYRNNTSSYTPTNDYNPATKKYVDDNKYTLPIASAEILGGIKLGEGLSVDENGVVSTAGGSESACYSIEFNNLDLPQYNTIYSSSFGSYKQTLLDFISNALNDSYKKNQTPIIFMNFKCQNFLSSIPYFILSKSDTFNILNPSASGVFYMLSDVKTVNNKYYYYYVSINYTYENNIFTCTTITFNKTQRDMLDIYNALSKENTTSFTPTGDYNPSTKLYTDKTHYENMEGYDATKTQVLKNVNGTLTWVDEE